MLTEPLVTSIDICPNSCQSGLTDDRSVDAYPRVLPRRGSWVGRAVRCQDDHAYAWTGEVVVAEAIDAFFLERVRGHAGGSQSPSHSDTMDAEAAATLFEAQI